MNTKYLWTTNRVFDTLSKYQNHKIISIEQEDDYIKICLEFHSTKFKSKTKTFIYIYADGSENND